MRHVIHRARPLTLCLLALVVLSLGIGWRRDLTTSNTALSPSPAKSSRPAESTAARVNANYGKWPLSFEANHGQTDQQVKFLSRGSGYNLFLTSTEAVLQLRKEDTQQRKEKTIQPHLPPSTAMSNQPSATLRMKLLNANAAPQIAGLEELPGKVNYFSGQDPKQWRANVPTYGKVRYQAVYPGVDLVYYGNQQQLEYDFTLAPGASPSAIKLAFEGAERLEVDATGDLVLQISGDRIRQHKPVIYQEVDGVRQEISGGYTLRGHNEVGFEVGAYDAARPLVIDPILVYSTYLGGDRNGPGFTRYSEGHSIAVDQARNVYITGQTSSLFFPTTERAFQTTYGDGFADVFVTKLNADGSALIYSTYLGGRDQDVGFGIALDAAGQAYITGRTYSGNFPITGAFITDLNSIPAFNNPEAFVAKLNPTGSTLVYSMYFGGTDAGYGVAVDAEGSAYVTGTANASVFPATPGAFQSASFNYQDAFVAKINPAGSALVYATLLGGHHNEDFGYAIAVDEAGSAYVTGKTSADDFPVTPDAFQAKLHGASDAFVTKLNPAGTALIYSTYLGGDSYDGGQGIALDPSGNAYLTGMTSSADFPLAQPFQTSRAGAFVTKLNPTGSALIYSSYLGAGLDTGAGIAVDVAGNAYVTGSTYSSTFPAVHPLQEFKGLGQDAFITKVSADGSTLLYSTLLGGSHNDIGQGIAVDAQGSAYIAGTTTSFDFPLVQPFLATSTSYDCFVAKISDTVPEAKLYLRSLITFNPPSAPQSEPVQGTVRLTGPAPAEGARVELSSSDPTIASVPASVLIPAGASSASFPVTLAPVSQAALITISATYREMAASGAITVGVLTVSSVTSNPPSMIGGNFVSLTVSLPAPAPTEGAQIALSSDPPSALDLPSSVTVPAGVDHVNFAVRTMPVGTETTVTISASYHGVVKNGALTIKPAELFGLDLIESVVNSGEGTLILVQGRITLSSFAPIGGAVVALSSSEPSVLSVPPNVGVPDWDYNVSFFATKKGVSQPTVVTISATYHGVTRSTDITVLPARLAAVFFNPNLIAGGNPSQGTVTLNDPAPPGGAVITLASDHPDLAVIPLSVAIPAGENSAHFSVTTAPATNTTSVIVSASYGEMIQRGLLSLILPEPKSLTLSPDVLPGSGGTTQATVALKGPAPAGGVVVTLSALNSPVITLPANLTIPAGASSGTLTIMANPTTKLTAVFISASYHGTSVTAVLKIGPTDIASLTISSDSAVSRTQVQGTITLTQPAPLKGAIITLSSNNPLVATVPDSVNVPSGARQVTFPVTALWVQSPTSVAILAAYGDSTQAAFLTVQPPNFVSIEIRANDVVGGNQAQGTLTLDSPAPNGGATITLYSDHPEIASPPASVTIPAGSRTLTFTVPTSPVTNSTFTYVFAFYNELSRSAFLMVRPADVFQITLSAPSVVGGNSLQGTVTLDGPAPAGGAVVKLHSGLLSSVITVPASVTIPAGSTSANFTLTTQPVTAPVMASPHATYRGNVPQTSLTVLPLELTALTLDASSVIGSKTAQGVVRLNGPIALADTVVTLASSNPAVAAVPSSVTIPAGTATATFTVTTNLVTAITPVTISAVYSGKTQTVPLSVSPDVVTITRTEYSSFKKQLTVQATSNNVTSLKVYVTATGKLIGLLTSSGGGNYTGTFSVATNPQSITVKSALGGSTIKSLTGGSSGGAAPPITLSSLTLEPASIMSGKTAQATITLSAAAPNDVAVSVSSSDAAATVPENVTVTAGTTSATFIVTTKVVSAATQITISASYGGTTRTVTLNLSPPPSAKDTVAIQRAEYTAFSKQLRVQATSTDSTATLQVFTSTGKLLGTLTPDSGGRYSGVFISTSAPQSITVKSSLGGSATKTVK